MGEKDRPVMAPEGFVYLALARTGPSTGASQEGKSIAEAGSESVHSEEEGQAGETT